MGQSIDLAEIASLLDGIREGMQASHEVWAARKVSRKAEMKFQPPDPVALRQRFAALVAGGLTDITIGVWRTSGEQQTTEDAYGVESQIKSVTAWAIANTERGIDLWVHDIDSGQEESRVGLDLIRDFVKTGLVKIVVAYRYDRLARNQYLSEMVDREFGAKKCRWVSATEDLPGGALGRLMKQIIMAIAQFEAALISQRMQGGKRASIQKKGVYAGGVTPYGYHPQGRRGDTGKGVLVLHPIEAQVVRLVVRLYETGYSQTAITTYLNRERIPKRKGESTPWSQSQVRRILINEPAYRGESLFGHQVTDAETIAHEAILEHRPDPADRTYIFNNRPDPLPQGTQVPKDLTAPPVPPTPRRNSVHSMTEDQARVLMMLFHLRDQGMLQKEIAARMNTLWLLSPFEGMTWRQTLVCAYLKRREVYEARIAEIGVTLDERINTGMDATGYDQDSVARELAGIAQIKALRAEGLSIPKIAVRLREEGVTTRVGASWGHSSIARVLSGQRRRAESFVQVSV